MARLYRILVESCWGLGVLSLLVAVVLKLAPAWAEMVRAAPRGGLILAGVLFLCVLATREMERLGSPTA